MNNKEIKISSIHIIPFDIGLFIDQEKKKIIEEKLILFPTMQIDSFWRGISVGLMISKRIDANIHLHIYEYGVGIFVIQEKEPFCSNDEFYAAEFCKHRNKIHDDIYLDKHADCDVINRVMTHIWEALKKYELRKTATDKWELRGILYVMSVDFLKLSKPLIQMNDADKKNLYIILNPSLLRKEEAYSKVAVIEDSRYINFNLEGHDTDLYKNVVIDLLDDCYQANSALSVYASWATLLVCQENDSTSIIRDLFVCLQVELQAFWFYTYILSQLKTCASGYKSSMKIKEILFDYSELEGDFKEISVRKLPRYLTKTWENMIETGFLESSVNDTKRTLQYMIDKNEKQMQEKQYKFIKINNILILTLAYIQIAPFLYNIFAGKYYDVSIFPIILIVALFIVIVIIAWKKE